FVAGPPLAGILKHGPLRPPQLRELLNRLADGLAAAHKKGVIHRDLSPDKVILPGGEMARAKIVGFGVEKISLEAKTIVSNDAVQGLYYASPEKIGLFGGQIDGRSDIYSLGLVLATAALGEPLNMGQSLISLIEARRSVPDLSRIPEVIRSDLAAMLQ